MTEPITVPEQDSVVGRLRDLAARSREATELDWVRERKDRHERERQEAVRGADWYVRNHFPSTFALVLTATSWQGYPRLDDTETEALTSIPPAAVAHLGEGVWIHHTRRRFGGGMATLLIACVCGNYREAAVDDDYALAREMDYLADTHDVCLGTCTPSRPATDGEDW
ncbi:hypothetical protein J7E88_17970 [Streptomyces sp. ISL-10]|uniref:hypothetical protein n=1 Tax=Streptomyces sp. ISL-10 TaxID=2819172 RepID=UPI001BE7854B|nr:hypothetical protein [Streptomyces sp. ISL-10]MBT2367143.1 hypothetical protein [Streptomyces sp. ISL-10]